MVFREIIGEFEMKYTKHYLNQNAKYFGGEKHGQVSNIPMNEAFKKTNTIALQEIFLRGDHQAKLIYVAFSDDKEKHFNDAMNDFVEILKDFDSKNLFKYTLPSKGEL